MDQSGQALHRTARFLVVLNSVQKNINLNTIILSYWPVHKVLEVAAAFTSVVTPGVVGLVASEAHPSYQLAAP
jgi:hypothetical protein